MRCKECNVDLAEGYKLCPLCGSPASDEEARIKGLTAVPYSKNPPKEAELKKEKNRLSVERIRAYFNR